MPRFFSKYNHGNQLEFSKEDSNHMIKSLRMKIGEHLLACDGKMLFECAISFIENDCVFADILSSAPFDTEPSVHITLYQALPKSDKILSIVQKSVELGVTTVVPIITDFCENRPSSDKAEKKLTKLRAVSREAAIQSSRCIVPNVLPFFNFKQAVQHATENSEITLFFYEHSMLSPHTIENIKLYKKIAVFIGSEGGFAQHEVELAEKAGFSIVSLGPRILRCETAPIAALSIINLLSGNM